MTTIIEEYQDRPAHRMRMQGSTRKSHKLQVLIQCANHARHDSNACAATNPQQTTPEGRREGERIRKLTTQRACHRGSNIKGAEWDAHGRIAAGLPTSRINARQSQPQTTPMHAPDHDTTNPWRDRKTGQCARACCVHPVLPTATLVSIAPPRSSSACVKD